MIQKLSTAVSLHNHELHKFAGLGKTDDRKHALLKRAWFDPSVPVKGGQYSVKGYAILSRSPYA